MGARRLAVAAAIVAALLTPLAAPIVAVSKAAGGGHKAPTHARTPPASHKGPASHKKPARSGSGPGTASASGPSAVERLGREIFHDAALSDPPGMACASCHAAGAGFTGPDSGVNRASGVMPGVVSGRAGRRKPLSVAYATFSPPGPAFDDDLQVWLGGNFWDGRASGTAAQARMPFLDPDEMANTPVGPYPPHAGGVSPRVAALVASRPYAPLLAESFGAEVVAGATPEVLYDLATRAIAAYEASAEVVPFSALYDDSPHGVPGGASRLGAAAERGLALFFGAAQCSACHSSAALRPVLDETGGRDVFTMYCYANVGVPRNPANPYARETDGAANPFGFNPAGASYVDYGLGANPNPAPDGTPFALATPGDVPAFRGLFRAPTLRNVDRRPGPGFVKAYMHNGVFKGLAEVVRFYNKRNIAADAAGREVAFDLRVGPPAGYAPLFAPPEVLDNVQNVAGASPADATGDVESNGQVGNLGLTPGQESDLVEFLRTLSDGHARRRRG